MDFYCLIYIKHILGINGVIKMTLTAVKKTKKSPQWKAKGMSHLVSDAHFLKDRIMKTQIVLYYTHDNAN